MESTKDRQLILVAIVAIVGIVGIVLGIYSMNKISYKAPSVSSMDLEQKDVVGEAAKVKPPKTNPPTVTCTDSDGGINFSKKGTTCVGQHCITDFCGYDIFEYTVVESYCKNNVIYADNGNCELGCKDGACKSSTIRLESPHGGTFNQRDNIQISWMSWQTQIVPEDRSLVRIYLVPTTRVSQPLGEIGSDCNSLVRPLTGAFTWDGRTYCKGDKNNGKITPGSYYIRASLFIAPASGKPFELTDYDDSVVPITIT